MTSFFQNLAKKRFEIMNENEHRTGLEEMEREARIKERSVKLKVHEAEVKKNSFSCQFCGCTEIGQLGKTFLIPSYLSLVQHESWCEKNPNSRRKKKILEKPVVSSGKIEYPKLRRILDLSERLELTRQQILNLIKHEMGENE